LTLPENARLSLELALAMRMVERLRGAAFAWSGIA
jgi:hypothetical protein